MRELLKRALKTHDYLSDSRPDPSGAEHTMKTLDCRSAFYKDVADRADVDAGFVVHLDGKPVRTPGKAPSGAADRDGGAPGGRRIRRPGRDDRSDRPCRSTAWSIPPSTASPPTRRRCWKMSCALLRPICSVIAPTAPSAGAAPERALGPGARLGARHRSARASCWPRASIHVDQPREAIAALGVHLSQRAEPMRLAALHADDDADRLGASGAGSRDRANSTSRKPGPRPMSTRTGRSSTGARICEAVARRANRKRDMLAAVRLLEALKAA